MKKWIYKFSEGTVPDPRLISNKENVEKEIINTLDPYNQNPEIKKNLKKVIEKMSVEEPEKLSDKNYIIRKVKDFLKSEGRGDIISRIEEFISGRAMSSMGTIEDFKNRKLVNNNY